MASLDDISARLALVERKVTDKNEVPLSPSEISEMYRIEALEARMTKHERLLIEEQLLTPNEIAEIYRIDRKAVMRDIHADLVPHTSRPGKGGKTCFFVRLKDARARWAPGVQP